MKDAAFIRIKWIIHAVYNVMRVFALQIIN